MISPKLRMLERQLARASATSPSPVSESSDVFMEAVDAAISKKADAQVKAAKDAQNKAEAETAELRRQISELSKDSNQRQMELLHKITDAKDVAKREVTELCNKHYGEMAQMHNMLDAARGEVATERQNTVRAVVEKEAAEKMCKHLEQMVAKLQDVKPATPVAPAVVERKLAAFKLIRDEMGRAIGVEQTV